MSVERALGAEYNTILEVDSSSGANVSGSQYRTGSYSFYIGSGSTSFQYRIGLVVTSRDEYYFQMAVRSVSLSSTIQVLKWTKSSVVLGGLKLTTGSYLEAYTGNFASLVGTMTTPCPTSTWFLVEVRIKIADADNGVLQVRMNGNLEIDYSGTGADTKPGDETEIDGFTIGSWSGQDNVYLDDIVIFNTLGSVNNSWPSGIPVYVIRPNAAGTYSLWTATAGSNYQCVDEIPPSITDYVWTTITGNKDTYNFPAADAGLSSGVAAIILDYWGQSTGSPPITQIKRLLYIGGSDYEGSGIALAPTFSKHSEVLETNPDDSEVWEKSDLDSIEAGMTSLT